MTRAEFQSSESNISQLNELLQFPIMKLALEVVKDESLTSMPTPIPGVSFGEQVAAAGAHAIGWGGSIKALNSLARKSAIFQQPDKSSLYQEEAERRLIASGQYTEQEINEILKK